MNSHRCGYSECTNCGKYVGKNHKCFMKKVKAEGGNCMTFKMKSCYNDDSIKKTDWCYPCRTYTEKYMFYDFEATQNTGTHTVNLLTLRAPRVLVPTPNTKGGGGVEKDPQYLKNEKCYNLKPLEGLGVSFKVSKNFKLV